MYASCLRVWRGWRRNCVITRDMCVQYDPGLVFAGCFVVLCSVRLERNRASARVRRQRKKSMAELYEKEVARLERSVLCGLI